MSPFLGTRGAGSNRAFGYAGAAAPAQVTGLTATDFGTSRAYNDGRIDLSWTAPANNGATISGYLIQRSTDGSTYSTLVANTGSSATTYSNTGLSSNQIYYYKVSAINAAGTGLASTAANATSTTVPQAPTIGTASRTNDTTVSLTFTAGATGGKTITSYAAVSSPSISLSTSGTSSPLSIAGTYASNQSYTFTLTAINANGSSTASGSSNSIVPNVPKPVVTGGTLTSDATYYYRTFTGSGTLSISNVSLTADYLVIAGGGAGGIGSSNLNYDCGIPYAFSNSYGGGGAGGFREFTSQTLAATSHTVVVGAGGTGGWPTYTAGNNSSFGSNTSAGGGKGFGGSGGSGGGGSSEFGSSGGFSGNGGISTPTTTPVQGNSGGNGFSPGGDSGVASGGGGGAGSAGSNGTSGNGGNGGSAKTSTINNTAYSGGGGGGGYTNGGTGGTAAGNGGGRNNQGSSGAGNRGGGGGSGGPATSYGNIYNGGSGGSGVVVVRYTKAQVD